MVKKDTLLPQNAAIFNVRTGGTLLTTALQKGNPSALRSFIEAFAICDLPSTERVRNICPQGTWPHTFRHFRSHIFQGAFLITIYQELVIVRDTLRCGMCVCVYLYIYINIYIYILYTGCPRRKGQNFGRVFLMLKYTDITQNTYIQS